MRNDDDSIWRFYSCRLHALGGIMDLIEYLDTGLFEYPDATEGRRVAGARRRAWRARGGAAAALTGLLLAFEAAAPLAARAAAATAHKHAASAVAR